MYIGEHGNIQTGTNLTLIKQYSLKVIEHGPQCLHEH